MRLHMMITIKAVISIFATLLQDLLLCTVHTKMLRAFIKDTIRKYHVLSDIQLEDWSLQVR
jgi:hypothetical protein